MTDTINNVIIEGIGINKLKYNVFHNLRNTDTILDIKTLIFNRYKIPVDVYYFIYNCKQLNNDQTLNEIKFQPEDALHVYYKIFTSNKL